MDSKVKSIKLFLFVLIASCAVTARAQTFDYQNRPAFNFSFSDAEINLNINPQNNTLSGSVLYNIKANMSGADTLSLDAAGLAIDSVLTDDQSVPFSIENGSLHIALADSFQAGESRQVQIFYHNTPSFGLLKSSDGTLWTSMLPLTTEHWLPVKDHPRVQMVTTLSLQIPAGYTAFASGVKTDENLMADSTKQVTFRTSRPIPVTALAFGLGHLREKSTSLGIKRIDSYTEIGSADIGTQQTIANNARQLLSAIEQATGKDYPYQRLNVVILNDHHWEEKNYGASTIFLYKNRGDWMSQLRRGLYAQWIGVFQHEEQWAEAWPVLFLETALHRKIANDPAIIDANTDEPQTGFSTVYQNFSPERWNDWQRMKSANLEQGSRLLASLLQDGPGIITPLSINDAWYDLTGQPSMQVPHNFDQSNALNSGVVDSVRYRVDYIQDVASGNLQLAFKAQQGSLPQPLSFPVQITEGAGESNAEVTVSGEVDSVSVTIQAGTRNVELMVPDDEPIALEQHKPVPYLLYQLRNAETTEAKRKAALQIGYQTDNPDLQLALNDVMNQDMEPEVKAALLRSYGAITNGANGTQQRFLDALQSDSPEVRAAALDVLMNYKSKEITGRLKTFSQNEQNADLSGKAMKLYIQRIDSSDAFSYTNTLVQQDTAGTRAIAAIAYLGEKGSTKKAVQLANYYIEPVYAYAVRKQALQVLLNYDQAADSWKKRALELVNDPDPRIRFLMAKNIGQIPGIDAAALLSSHQEYDARVRRVMK